MTILGNLTDKAEPYIIPTMRKSNSLDVATTALQAEADYYFAEAKRLQGIIDQINGGSSGGAPKRAGRPAGSGKKRGRKPNKQKNGSASASDLSRALEIIKGEKKGVKALKLAAELKKAKVNRPSKDELLATGRVKQSGTGGGTTYTFVG